MRYLFFSIEHLTDLSVYVIDFLWVHWIGAAASDQQQQTHNRFCWEVLFGAARNRFSVRNPFFSSLNNNKAWSM